MKKLIILVIICSFLFSLSSVMAGKSFCGDNIAQRLESCDGSDLKGKTCTDFGFSAGTLSCTASCTFDTSGCYSAVCGNNIKEGTEICDGINLNEESCVSQDFDGGVLACKTDCSGFDRSSCTRAGYLEVHYIDVGQGDSIFILSPEGKTLLIDAGDNYYGGEIINYLSEHLINSLDYMLSSHYHADHIGGSDYVLSNIPVGMVYDRGESYDTLTFQDYVMAAGDKRTTLHLGDTINMGANINAQVLQMGYGSDENGKSVVLKLSYNGHNFLFGGDCTSECEATFNPGNINVYKVHHHGSKYSSSQSFLDLITPEISVISVGANNSYGHPAQETLDRLWGIGSDIYRTDKGGDVLIKCDETNCWTNRQPYPPSFCGNGVCDLGESCTSCSVDCVGKNTGKTNTRYCCGNGICEAVGENIGNCAIDCG